MYIRIVTMQLLYRPCQKAHAIGLTSTNRNISGNILVRQCYFTFSFVNKLHDFFRTLTQDHTFLRQRYTAVAANQKLFSQFLLHIFELTGECGLRKVQCLCRTGNTLFPADGQKILQNSKFHKSPSLKVYFYYNPTFYACQL